MPKLTTEKEQEKIVDLSQKTEYITPLDDYWNDPYSAVFSVNANRTSVKTDSVLPDNWEELPINRDFDPQYSRQIAKKVEEEKIKEATTVEEETEAQAQLEKEKKLAKQTVSLYFEQFSNSDIFESWHNGKLKDLFKNISNIWEKENWNDNDRETLVDTLETLINHVKTLGSTIIKNKFHQTLGEGLVAFCNALIKFYNFITANPLERPSLEITESEGDKPRFKKLNKSEETKSTETTDDMEAVDWQQISTFFSTHVTKKFENSNSIYKDIQEEINKSDEQEKNKKIENKDISFEITEKSKDLIDKLIHQNVIKPGDWIYDASNILFEDKLKDLQSAITNTQELTAKALKELQKKQYHEVINKDELKKSLREFPIALKTANKIYETKKEKIINLSEQKLWFRELNEVLEKSKNKLEKYLEKCKANAENISNILGFLNMPHNKLHISVLIPFITKMDNIVSPILGTIASAYTANAFQISDDIENYTATQDNPTPGATENRRITNIQDLTKKFISYLHDPKSVGLDEKIFVNKTDMNETDLYAYYKEKEKKANKKNEFSEKQLAYIASLKIMMQYLNDTEMMDLEGKQATLNIKLRGTDYENLAPELLSEDSDRSSLRNERDEDDEDDDQEDEENIRDIRLLLRLVGVIANKYNNEFKGDLTPFQYNKSSKLPDKLKQLRQAKTYQDKLTFKKFILDAFESFSEKLSPNTSEKPKPEEKDRTKPDEKNTSKQQLKSKTEEKSKIKQPQLPDKIVAFAVQLRKYIKYEQLSFDLTNAVDALLKNISNSSKLQSVDDDTFMNTANTFILAL